jgi:hypothetical protein
MSPLTQVVIAAVSAGLPTLTVLVSLLINNQRLGDLGLRLVDINQRLVEFEKRMDQRFAEHREMFRSELFRVEQVMDARLKHLEEHLQR